METINDVKCRLQIELNIWFNKNTTEPHYMYYLEQTAEHNSGLLILKKAPPNKDYKLVTAERIPIHLPLDTIFVRYMSYLKKLPILSI